MIDADAVNARLAGSGWTVDVVEDDSVGGSVIVTRTETGEGLDLDAEHVPLVEPAYVIVARRDGEEHRFSPTTDDAEMLIALWDLDTDRARLADHEAGEHAAFRPDCQRCHEDKWAREAADARERALYGGRADDVVSWLKGDS